ncbi:MAG: GTPase [Planctomycetota bacterium]
MPDITVEALTGPGRAALHAVLLCGKGSASIIDQAFCGRGLSPHGTIIDADGDVIDDAILIEWPGEAERFVLTLHGSPFIRDRVIERLMQLGASAAPSTARLWPARGQKCCNKVREEALLALPTALSHQACAFLLEQASERGFSGWLARSVEQGVVRQELDELLRLSDVGIGMLVAARVVLAGEPNAGKSTLFNVLTGHQRVITSHQPGTTRDLIEEEMCLLGFPIQLVDGAGLRSAVGEVEREGVRRMEAAMEAADLVVYLVPPGAVEPVAGMKGTPRGRTLVIHSRRDEDPGGEIAGLGISSVTAEGLPQLQERILQEIYGDDRNLTGRACPFLPGHRDLLMELRSALDADQDPVDILRHYPTSEMGAHR